MHKKPKIIGFGEILWDVYPADKKAGGAPVNFVFHAIQMGASGYAISAVGEDKDGEELLEMLGGYSIPYCIPKVANPTGTVQVADESISIEQFSPVQASPYGDTIRIQFPYNFPRGTDNVIDISRMRMTAILPVNVKINPSLTVMDLTVPNTIEVINSDRTIDKHVIIGELVQ
jgi:hypothetical protein